jgi:hypothetical protein
MGKYILLIYKKKIILKGGNNVYPFQGKGG